MNAVRLPSTAIVLETAPGHRASLLALHPRVPSKSAGRLPALSRLAVLFLIAVLTVSGVCLVARDLVVAQQRIGVSTPAFWGEAGGPVQQTGQAGCEAGASSEGCGSGVAKDGGLLSQSGPKYAKSAPNAEKDVGKIIGATIPHEASGLLVATTYREAEPVPAGPEPEHDSLPQELLRRPPPA